ncbi:MAG: PHB depolymerase family esterase [Anaerolineae bacterium]|nr:PHB depolymerase family esterase [Anaerolineae bacterium]
MKRLIRVLLLIISLVALLLLIVVVAYRQLNQTNGTVVVAGEERAYLLYVPEIYDAATATPLVIALHGFVQWPASLVEMTGWNELAEEHGFIVVYPSGTGLPLRWRAGGGSGDSAGTAADVAFVDALIDELARSYNLDPNRIYANGLSNGGGMTSVLTCELAGRIAAAGMVAGAYLYPWDKCDPARPVPVIIFHGTDDTIVPYAGGRSGPGDRQLPSIPVWVDSLAARNGCDEEPAALPARGDATGVAYTGCAGDVLFYTISGGGHTWPGGPPLYERISGHTTQDLNATAVMWAFFTEHPLSGR